MRSLSWTRSILIWKEDYLQVVQGFILKRQTGISLRRREKFHRERHQNYNWKIKCRLLLTTLAVLMGKAGKHWWIATEALSRIKKHWTSRSKLVVSIFQRVLQAHLIQWVRVIWASSSPRPHLHSKTWGTILLPLLHTMSSTWVLRLLRRSLRTESFLSKVISRSSSQRDSTSGWCRARFAWVPLKTR